MITTSVSSWTFFISMRVYWIIYKFGPLLHVWGLIWIIGPAVHWSCNEIVHVISTYRIILTKCDHINQDFRNWLHQCFKGHTRVCFSPSLSNLNYTPTKTKLLKFYGALGKTMVTRKHSNRMRNDHGVASTLPHPIPYPQDTLTSQIL